MLPLNNRQCCLSCLLFQTSKSVMKFRPYDHKLRIETGRCVHQGLTHSAFLVNLIDVRLVQTFAGVHILQKKKMVRALIL